MYFIRPATLLAVLLFAVLFSSFTPPPVVLEEVIVQIPGATQKTQADIRTRFASVQGVYVNGYCESLKIYLIRVDRSLQPDNAFLETVLHDQYQLSYFIKAGCTIEQVRTMCGMPASDSDPALNPQ
ncbi:MAG: hypothetical protein MUC87_07965 [Bacteroidia bacterium]|jgi:hypothetical protein|nr:hypothetical protein [Bacteroidia bacterium]